MFYYTDKEMRVIDFVLIEMLTSQRIILRMKTEKLILEGDHLEITYFNDHEIIISGTLRQLKREDFHDSSIS